MKSTVLTAVLLLSAAAVTHAQLSFLPQVGFENNKTCLNYNSLSTAGMDANFRANLRTDYRFKGGHGPYLSLGTAPAPMSFSFTGTGSLLEQAQAVKNNLQFRIESGYQYTSRAIQFKKKAAAPVDVTTATTEVINENATERKSCGSYTYKSSCGEKKKITAPKQSVLNGLNMRLQPSLGLAYLPSANPGITETANGFQHNAAWKTALVPAMGFEFANGKQRFLTLTVFYTKPLGVQDETYTAFSGAKAVTTNLSSYNSTWGIAAGVPFSFVKNNASKIKKQKKDCQRIIYRRCYKS